MTKRLFDEAGTNSVTFENGYSWIGDTFQVQDVTLTLPAVPTTQNGANTTDSRVARFGAFGEMIWERDERGPNHRRSS